MWGVIGLNLERLRGSRGPKNGMRESIEGERLVEKDS